MRANARRHSRTFVRPIFASTALVCGAAMLPGIAAAQANADFPTSQSGW
ncbi:hypothetical protein ACIP1U_30105 [Cupriavidus sp. NPDC089707]